MHKKKICESRSIRDINGLDVVKCILLIGFSSCTNKLSKKVFTIFAANAIRNAK